MVYEKKMSGGNGMPGARPVTPVKAVSHLASDVLELSELQAQLLLVDAKASAERARTAAMMGGLGAVVLLAALPLALATGAAALVEFAEWTWTASLGMVALAAIVVAGVLFLLARSWLKRGLATWERSRDEFKKNLAWVKSALQRSSSSPARASHGHYPD